MLEPDRPTKVTYIQPQNEMSTSFTSPSKLNIMAALGETVVGFDFGGPQEIQPLPQQFQIPKQEDVLTVWPVFFVKGNGDIIVSYSEVTSNRSGMYSFDLFNRFAFTFCMLNDAYNGLSQPNHLKLHSVKAITLD